MKSTLLITVPAFLLLTACGGGGGGENAPDPQPQPQPSQEEIEDNNTANDSLDDPVEVPDEVVDESSPIPVALDNQLLIFTDRTVANFSERVPTTGTEDFVITIIDEDTIEMEIDGNTITLERSTTDTQNFGPSAGGFLRFQHSTDDVVSAFINLNDATTRREGTIVVGDLTETAEANALIGTAEYVGVMHARITGQNLAPVDSSDGPPTFDGFGGGRVTANFDDATVSGRFNLTDPNAPPFDQAAADQFPRVLVELNETDIVDGGFDGSVNVTFRDEGGLGNPDLAFTSGNYQGDLYGPDGRSVGGQFIGTIDNDGNDYVIQGGFAANQ